LIEGAKALTQLIGIAVLGGGASFLYAQYSKEHDHRKNKLQEETKQRRELLDSLINVRAQVEKTRRNYRLVQPADKKDGYRDAIKDLLEARLELSQVMHDGETLRDLFAPDHDEIERKMLNMR
jgi:molecular chaperone GrpE (heat shock protein)